MIDVLLHPRITAMKARDRLVLTVVLFRCGVDHWERLSVREIADLSGYSERVVYSALRELQAAGIVERARPDRRRAGCYRVVDLRGGAGALARDN